MKIGNNIFVSIAEITSSIVNNFVKCFIRKAPILYLYLCFSLLFRKLSKANNIIVFL